MYRNLLGILIIAIVVFAVIGGLVYWGSLGNEDVDKYVPLLGFESTLISPTPGIFGVTTIKEGETATITVKVENLSNEYKNDGKIKISFEHEDAYQFFEIEEDTKNVGTIQEGGTSGPISFVITAIKDPGGYDDIVFARIFIDENLNAEKNYELKIE